MKAISFREESKRKKLLRQRLEPLVDAFVRLLGDNLISQVLFGSKARGEGKEGSDWDILLIARDLPKNLMERQIFLRTALPWGMGEPISLLPKTRAEFEGSFPSLYLDIAMDGIILWDRDEFMRGKFRQIRQLIRKAGLERHLVGKDLIWQWKNPPKGKWRLDWSGVYGL